MGSYPGEVTILRPDSEQTEIQIPKDAKPGQTIHVILEGTDNGVPALTRYRRVILRVK